MLRTDFVDEQNCAGTVSAFHFDQLDICLPFQNYGMIDRMRRKVEENEKIGETGIKKRETLLSGKGMTRYLNKLIIKIVFALK